MGSLAHLAAMTGRGVYVPSSGRRPVLKDPWYVISKRKNLARRLRRILYGKVVHCPVHRMETWSWLVREFVYKRDFRYIGLLDEARRFVTLFGVVEAPDEFDKELDLDLVKAFQVYLYRRREELETWRNHPTPEQSAQAQAAVEAKSLALSGVCALCGNDLPCESCNMPAVVIDGKGGLRAI